MATAGIVHPCNPYTARSETTKLAADPTGAKLVYTNGRAVVVRDLSNPALSFTYTEHTQAATVARISPSGFYCASGDAAGNVRIWDVAGSEHVLKYTTRALGGRVNDLAWDGESKRLVVGGEGRDKFGAAFFMDSGSSCGEITGHSKPITSVAVRHQRPFRAVSGSDDASVCLHTGVPFKYDKLLSEHTRFVRDVAYAADGSAFASVGSDGRLVLYDGGSGEVLRQSTREASLMAVSWARTGSKLATAGADGVVALWDAETGQVAQEYRVGEGVEQQQNGLVWASENAIVSVSLDGTLNVFDPRKGGDWTRLYGPTRAVTAGARSGETFYAGSFDGGVRALKGDTWQEVKGGHSARIAAMATGPDGTVHTAGWDDRASAIKDGAYTAASVPTAAQPNGIATGQAGTLISTPKGVLVRGAQEITHAGDYTAVGASPTTDVVAYGKGRTLTLATVGGDKLDVVAEFTDNKSDILSIAFSPDGRLVAAGDAAGRIVLVDAEKKETLVSSRWAFHTARVTALAFSEDGQRLASAGLDESVYIWEVGSVGKRTAIKNAHPGGVTGVAWTPGGLITVGADACARTWKV